MPGLEREGLAKVHEVAKEHADKASEKVRAELLDRIEKLEKKLLEQAAKKADKRETRKSWA